MEKLGQNEIYSQLLGQHPILRTYKGDELINEYTPLYTPPLDWRDIRSDCPNNSIALYAAHGRINNPNYNIKKVTGAVKCTVVGNPTIIDGIASNFSSSNYLRTSLNWAQINTKFDIVICARPSGGSALMCIGSGESGKMKLYFSTSKITFQTGNSSQDQLEIETTFNNNLFYYIHIKRNESTTFLSYSTDGTNWQNEISGNLVYTTQSNFMRFGYNANIPSTFGGSIDLNQTYIKVNNELWFGSQMQLISANPNIYLQSTGTQYIDTGFKPTANTKMEVAMSSATSGGTYPEISCGSRVGVNNSAFVIYARAHGNDSGFALGNYTNIFYVQVDPTIKHIYKLSSPTTSCEVDGVLASSSLTSFDGNSYDIYLFGFNNGGNPTQYQYRLGQIYYVKIWDNDTLVRHYVPVPQGLVIGNFTCPSNGMFDIVEQKFYGNEDTGDFIYGNDSPETITYDNLGFTATCTGGYKIFIDGNQYGGVRTSGSQCNIIWSQSGINTGNNIITPSTLKAHKIWIEPVIDGNNITVFHCVRVAESGNEEQGVLWEHFNLSTSINISNLNATGNIGSQAYKNTLLTACTAKNNKLNVTGDLEKSFFYCSNLEYLPVIDANNASINLGYFGFAFCSKIKKIDIKNLKFNDGSYAFHNNESLESLPKGIDYSSTRYMANYLTYAKNIKDFVFDVSSATLLRVIQCFGNSSTFMSGFKGLRVSSSAPFDGVSPQVNVSYTGMDRQALVTLFNDLPTVTGGQIINITGCTGTNDLTVDDKAIATNKGWTLTL